MIKKTDHFDFLCWNLKKKRTSNRKRQGTQKKPRQKYRKRTQSGGFLNRYDFAYAGSDIVNQAGKIAPGIIRNASAEIIILHNKEYINSSTREEKKLKGFYQRFLEELLRMFIKHLFVW